MMSYSMTNGYGDHENQPSIEQMEAFLRDLNTDDEEHGAAWLSDDNGTVLEYSVGGNLAYDRVGQPPRHMSGVAHAKVVELWTCLANRQLEKLEREPWQPGASAPLPPEELARRQREIALWQSQRDREFYDTLGTERTERTCRASECTRGTVEYSVFCRPHHFESVFGRKSPFDH